jgi:sodium-coupled neutral amino acid transporter 11
MYSYEIHGLDWTVRLLVTDAKLSGQKTYQSLIDFCYGKTGLWAISIFQFIFAYGGESLDCFLLN